LEKKTEENSHLVEHNNLTIANYKSSEATDVFQEEAVAIEAMRSETRQDF
jgi:hypothetical protein